MADSNKPTTLEQLRMLALREKADYGARIIQLTELLINGLEEAKPLGITVSLPVSSWSGREQTVKNDAFLADGNYWYIVCGDGACFTEYSSTGVKADDVIQNGEITFRCEITPDIDLTANIIRLEVVK